MLQAIRNNAQGVFVWIVVGLIVISFALFGLGSYLSGASKVVAASVNDVEISSTELTRAYQNYQENLRNMLGDQYRPEMFGTARVKKEVLQRLITTEVMNQMLTEQGYSASPQQVLEKIKQYKEFEEAGSFSAKRYKEVLSIQGMNGEYFENDLSRGIASKQLREAITKSSFVTKEEQKLLAALENQKRNIGYFDVSDKHYRKSIKLSDEEINTYYKKNSHLFLTEEKVQIEYIELNMDEVAKAQDVTDKMIKLHYESSPENYMANDDASAKKKLESLRKKINKGADFAALAKKHSHDKGSAKQGGDLGFLTRGVSEQFDKIVFALKKGELSKVVKSKEGYQLILLDEIRNGDPEERKVRHILIKPKNKLKSLAEVRKAIHQELKYQLAGKVFFDDADQLNNLSYESPDSLAPVADTLGLKIKVSTLMTRRGGAGIFSNPKILSAAFSDEVLKQGRNSELLELSDSQLVVLRVKKHIDPSVRPLKIVKSQISRKLLQDKSSNKVRKVTTDILMRVNNNESIAEIKKQYPEVKWNKTGWIKRTVEAQKKVKKTVPTQLRKFAFTMPKPADAQTQWDKTNLTAGSQAVIALFKIEEVKDGQLDHNKISRSAGDADYSSFIEYLNSQADISISQSASESDAGINLQ